MIRRILHAELSDVRASAIAARDTTAAFILIVRTRARLAISAVRLVRTLAAWGRARKYGAT